MGSVTNPKKPTLESLADQMRRLQERIEDMADLIELRSVIERNRGKPGVHGNRRKRSWILTDIPVRQAESLRQRTAVSF